MYAPAGNGGYMVTHYTPSSNPDVLHLNQPPADWKWPILAHPKALGFTQIFVSGAQICLGVVLCTAVRVLGRSSVVFGIPFWIPLLFTVSGVLSISVQNKTNHKLIQATLAMNIISSIAAGVEIIFFSFDLHYSLLLRTCHIVTIHDPCTYYGRSEKNALLGISLVLLFLSFLELGITLATSVFGCLTTCDCPPCNSGPQPMVIMQRGPAPDVFISMAPVPGIPAAQGLPVALPLPTMAQPTYPRQVPADASLPCGPEPCHGQQMRPCEVAPMTDVNL